MAFVKYTPKGKNFRGAIIFDAEFIRSAGGEHPGPRGNDMLIPKQGKRNDRPHGMDRNAPRLPEDA